MNKEQLAKIFNRKVMLRGALKGLLFAVCICLLVFTNQHYQDRGTPSHMTSISLLAMLSLVFPVVAPFTNNIISPTGALILGLFWTCIGTLLAVLLHDRTRKAKVGIWIASIVSYLAFAFLMLTLFFES